MGRFPWSEAVNLENGVDHLAGSKMGKVGWGGLYVGDVRNETVTQILSF